MCPPVLQWSVFMSMEQVSLVSLLSVQRHPVLVREVPKKVLSAELYRRKREATVGADFASLLRWVSALRLLCVGVLEDDFCLLTGEGDWQSGTWEGLPSVLWAQGDIAAHQGTTRVRLARRRQCPCLLARTRRCLHRSFQKMQLQSAFSSFQSVPWKHLAHQTVLRDMFLS